MKACLALALLLAAALPGATGPLVGQRGPAPAAPLVPRQMSVPPLVFSLAPRATTYARWSDYRQTLRLDPTLFRAEPVREAWLEVRQLAQNRLVARLACDITQAYSVVGGNMVAGAPLWFEALPPQHLEQLKDFAAGEFQLALVVNGLRASNVVAVKIEPRFSLAAAPAAEAGSLEPPPPGTEPAQLVFWFTVPAAVPQGYAALLRDPRLLVDDAPRAPPESRGGGPAGNFETPGYQGVRTIRLGDYTPPVDPDKAHAVRVLLGTWRSAPFRFDAAEQPLNRAWDRMSAAAAAAPPASASAR